MSDLITVKKAIDDYRNSSINSKKSLDMAIQPYIGKWVIVTGNHRIAKDIFDRSFPQGIFGKIIGFNPAKGFELRTYCKKRKGEERHPMMHGSIDFIKIFKQ